MSVAADPAAFDLSDRTVLVTGASSGLGAQFARALAQAGARVVLAARRAELLDRVVDEIAAAGQSAAAVPMDVTDEGSIAAAFDQATAHFGLPTSIIVNAGISAAGPAVELAAEDFDAVMRVNVRGAYLTAREAARRMLARSEPKPGGRIVLVSSIGGLTPLAGLSAYCISKAAVVMMGKSLAREWRRSGVNVNVICPGYVETELNSEWFSSPAGAKQVAGFPRRRLMTAEDLRPMVLYLASSESEAVTGSVFTIDDGQSA